GVGIAPLDLQEPVGSSQLGSRTDAHVFGSELLEEQQLFVRRGRRRLDAQFNARRSFLRSRASVPPSKRCRAERSERHATEVSSVDTAIARLIVHDDNLSAALRLKRS